MVCDESQTVVSSAVGIPADTLSRWERGITCPSANELCLLAKYYNASISELYYGTDETDAETLGATTERPRTRPPDRSLPPKDAKNPRCRRLGS